MGKVENLVHASAFKSETHSLLYKTRQIGKNVVFMK